MPKNFRGKNYLKLIDFTSEDMRYLLDLAKEFKSLKRAGVPHKYLEGKTSFYYLKRLQLELVVHLKLQVMT